MIYKRNPNAIYIELAPVLEKDFWTGEVEMNLITSPDCKLDEESKNSFLHLSQLMCSVLPLMELEPSLTTKLENVLKSVSKNKDNRLEIIDNGEDNIIRVDFSKKARH